MHLHRIDRNLHLLSYRPSCHNPKIVKYKDTYLLYYMGSTHPFEEVTEETADELTLSSKWCIAGRWGKRIGLATSKSPNGPWKRLDAPVLDVKPNSFYSFLTSNPSSLIKKDGSVVLLFKGRSYREDEIKHTHMFIGVATAPSYGGKWKTYTPVFCSNEWSGRVWEWYQDLEYGHSPKNE